MANGACRRKSGRMYRISSVMTVSDVPKSMNVTVVSVIFHRIYHSTIPLFIGDAAYTTFPPSFGVNEHEFVGVWAVICSCEWRHQLCQVSLLFCQLDVEAAWIDDCSYKPWLFVWRQNHLRVLTGTTYEHLCTWFIQRYLCLCISSCHGAYQFLQLGHMSRRQENICKLVPVSRLLDDIGN